MEEITMKKINMIIALVLAVAMIMAAGVVLTACGGKKNTDPTAATTATTATTAATQQATTNGSSSQTAQNGNSSSQSAASSAGSLSDDGYISENAAIENVRAQIGTGGKIISYTKGFTPDGIKAWIVVTEPVTTSDGPTTVTYYTNDQFCYAASQDTSNAAGDYLDEASALQQVREQVGTGAQILDYYQGTTPDGMKAWVVTVQPITTSDGPETVIYYVNHQFCYSAQ